jgi:hypothetical protein
LTGSAFVLLVFFSWRKSGSRLRQTSSETSPKTVIKFRRMLHQPRIHAANFKFKSHDRTPINKQTVDEYPYVATTPGPAVVQLATIASFIRRPQSAKSRIDSTHAPKIKFQIRVTNAWTPSPTRPRRSIPTRSIFCLSDKRSCARGVSAEALDTAVT